jgi:hypothetical protein
MTIESEVHREWIWRSSLEHQQEMQWPYFSSKIQRLWSQAFDEADRLASLSKHIRPVACIAKKSSRGTRAGQVGFLTPGTIVWACLKGSPIWPARIFGLSETQHAKLRSSDDPSATEPLMFFNDPDQEDPLYTSTHSCYGFTADRCWQVHMRERTLEMARERGLSRTGISRKTWKQWEEACDLAFELVSSRQTNLPRKRPRS